MTKNIAVTMKTSYPSQNLIDDLTALGFEPDKERKVKNKKIYLSVIGDQKKLYGTIADSKYGKVKAQLKYEVTAVDEEDPPDSYPDVNQKNGDDTPVNVTITFNQVPTETLKSEVEKIGDLKSFNVVTPGNNKVYSGVMPRGRRSALAELAEVTGKEIKVAVNSETIVTQNDESSTNPLTITITDDTVDGDTSSISNLQASPGADGEISLREAVIAANNTPGDDRIILTGDQTYNLTREGIGEDAAATGDLDILSNGKITIETAGAGTAVIDAGGIDRVFDVLDASLELNNVLVRGGNSTGDYPNNRGGGIAVIDGSLALTNSEVSGNRATWGGGIYNLSGTASITNSTVSGNTAAERGGGMYNRAGTASITNSRVSGNMALSGGGIASREGTASISIDNSQVMDNTADWGGGINNRDGTASISNSTVSGNTAEERGGGIYNRDGTAIIVNNAVRDNRATIGGGIFNWEGTASIANSTVSGNRADLGAGIFNSGGTASIANSTVSGNRASYVGGGIHNSWGTASIANSTVRDNWASWGGGIYNSSGTAIIAYSTVSGNTGDWGGGIRNDDEGTANIYNSTVSGNLAERGGGGISNYQGTVSIKNSAVSGNTAATAGGGGISNSGSASIDNSTVSDNTAIAGGGISNSGTAIITNSTVSGNRVSAGGGGIENRGGRASIDNSTVSGNTASSGGGGIENRGGRASIDNSTVSGNTASSGGGIFNSSGTAIVAKSTVFGNTAMFGGGIFNNSGTASIDNSTVRDNTAEWSGGVRSSGMTSIANTTVRDNTATAGGGIGNSGTASIANTTVRDNTASLGGGIYNSGTANIANSTVSDNAASSGGGIRNSGTANIANTTVSDNTASEGGGIRNSGTASIDDSIIAANADDKDLHGTFTSGGYNLIGNGDGITGFTNDDIVGNSTTPVDPKLGPLQNNGGETFTHALETGSPAINAGNNSNIPIDKLDVDGDGNTTEKIDIDQRGAIRIEGGQVDIGAYELGNINLGSNLKTINDMHVGLETLTLTVDFTEEMDTSVHPTIAFPTEDPTSTIIFNSGSWSDSYTYVATYDVADANETINDIDVKITVEETAWTQNDFFSINTASQIQFSVPNYHSNENAGTSNAVTLTRTGDTSKVSEVQVSIAGGTATGNETDFRSSDFPMTVEFVAGETSKTVEVSIIDDTVYEPGAAETITFSVASKKNTNIGTQNTTTLNISDNDSQPPTVTGITTDTGTSSSDGITSDTTLIFTGGSAQANSTVELFIDGSSIGTTTADGAGNWSFDHTGTTLAEGSYNITATSIDAAGNTSGASSAFAVIVDTTAPTVTVNSLTTFDTTPPLTGTVNDNTASLQVTVNGNNYPGTNNGDGTWTLADNSITEALSEGTYDVAVTATDTAGNIGNDSTNNGLEVAIASVTIGETSGSTSVSEGGATDTYMVVLDAPPTADAIVHITPDSQTTVNPTSLTFTSGNWDTPQTVTVTADDDATVEGTHSSTITHAIAPSSASEYLGLSIDNVTVNITDNDEFNEIPSSPGSPTVTGTDGPDRITGGLGRYTISGGLGSDQFKYTDLRDAGDTITDFTVSEDTIVLTELFTSLGQTVGSLADAKSRGFLSFIDRSPDTLVMLDPDGTGGRGRGRPLVTLKDVDLANMDAEVNFIF